MFQKTNSGGFNLENIYHLFCIQGWVDSFLMNPMLLVSGGTALIVAIALSYWLTVVLAWSIGKQEGKSATVVYSCLLLLFLWFFVRDNIVLVQLHGIIQDMRIARKYVTFDEKTFKSCGIKQKEPDFRLTLNSRGSFLSSQAVSHQLLSALRSLTAVFGMGTGVSFLPLPPHSL